MGRGGKETFGRGGGAVRDRPQHERTETGNRRRPATAGFQSQRKGYCPVFVQVVGL
jgi:hypothetical protein